MIIKVNNTAESQGSRLLPLNNELPKGLLPVFFRDKKNALLMKPTLRVLSCGMFRHM